MTNRKQMTLCALVAATILTASCESEIAVPILDAGLSTSAAAQGIEATPSTLSATQTPLIADKPESRVEAARFLNQATFGATSVEVDRLMSMGYSAWIDEQFALPRQQTYAKWIKTDGPRLNPVDFADGNSDRESAAWYTLAKNQPDQLRLRTAWALSQIFVVSRAKVGGNIILWMDTTADGGFGTYREMLQLMTFSPVMAQFLDYRENSDRDGRIPDQNYAREIMQLFSIGLWQLNADGTLKFDASGQRIPTYSQADVTGLSYVFTGLNLQSGGDRVGTCRDDAGRLLPATNDMKLLWRCELSVWPYASTRQHSFLGVTIPAISKWSSARILQDNGRKNIGIALDTLANHPNTAPFISKLLIQRFTTSNPSPAYVARVAAAFAKNGKGVRGDFKAIVKQILLDPEARTPAVQTPYEFGKIREPILAIAQLNRVLNANDGKGNVWAGSSGCRVHHNIVSELERPYNSATVFNYYRPTFAAPSGKVAAQNMVAPEMQITDTSTTLDWSRFVQQTLQRGGTGCANAAKRQNSFAYDEFWAESANAEQLADKVLLLLAPGANWTDLRPALVRSINSIPAATQANRIDRIKIAIMLTMLTPEYRVQR
ncbi:DUF1800 family protein [Aquidulcibacter sp.]|uniref:DUF1800 family protein n=1 Tax=Aquidulcibacter sp. TaxID=2052990 RepID=UPI0037BFD802